MKYLLFLFTLALSLYSCVDLSKSIQKQLEGSYVINEISYKNKPYKEALSINTLLIEKDFISLPKTIHFNAEEALWKIK